MHDIDFVITWVDGSDPAWIAEREKYRKDSGDQRAERFRDWGLLRYWFRSVEKYAPWVRKIHFVTWGHVPEWLDTSHPKLHIVKHEDFIPPEYLPTFNSHTIELNLHRIEGLAEHFVYFNDDVFLTKETPPEFFFKDGLPRACFGLEAIYFASNSIGWISGSNLAVINDHFHMSAVLKQFWRKMLSPRNGMRKVLKTCLMAVCCDWFPGFFHWHLSFAFLRSTFDEIWHEAYDILDETCRCHFREKTNVSPNLMNDWQLAKGTFMPLRSRYGHCYHLTDRRVKSLSMALREKKYFVICINDMDRLSDPSVSFQKILQTFNEILPASSTFENGNF